MTDARVREFAERAEQILELPDLGRLADRGKRLRRRRRTTAVAGLAAAAVTVAGGYLAAVDRKAEVDPVDDTSTGGALAYPGSGTTLAKLRGGTYELRLDREGFPAHARFTVPEGWRGWYGPSRPYMKQGYVGILVGDVEEVADRVCQVPVSDMRPVGDSPEALVEALTDLPRHPVVEGPERTTFAGWPSTHLVLRADRNASCPRWSGFIELWNSPGGGGLVPALGPGAVIEQWVVELGSEAVLVTASIGPGTPDWAVKELDAVVDSVELVEGQD